MVLAGPVLVRACDLDEDPAWSTWAGQLFDEYRNEGAASRGIDHIAPNVFIDASRSGYFRYSRHGRVVLVYAFIGPGDAFDRVAKELLAHCEHKGYVLNFLSPEPIPEIAGKPFSATPFGVVQRLQDIASFRLKGGAMHRLRYQVSGFQKAGRCRLDEYVCGTDPAVAVDIARVIDAWRSKKTKVNPLVLTAREEILAGTLHPRHRLFLTYVDDVLQNVVLISPLSARDNGYLMDLEFYGDDMPRGGLEFAIVGIVEKLASEGCDVLSLGGTYGCRIETSPTADVAVNALLDDLHKQGIFNDQGNFQFKNKFRPLNRTIYLCRPADAGRADNVIDIIMMIADPSRSQTVDTENHTPLGPFVALDHGSAAVDVVAAASCLPATDRLVALEAAGFNPLCLPDDAVRFDTRSDSWAQVRTDAKAERIGDLHARLQQPMDVDGVLREALPFDAFVTTESGRSAEGAFYKAFPRRGKVLQNIVFPTNLAHQIACGFTPRELPVRGFAGLDGVEGGRADLDLERLAACLADDAAGVAMVFVELANNAAGGASISLDHLRAIRRLIDPHRIPLVLDATRVIENVRLERHIESLDVSDTWAQVREWMACGDAVIVSMAKDFGIDRGGLVCLRDAALWRRVRDEAQRQDTLLNAFDRKLVALALHARADLPVLVHTRMATVQRLAALCRDHGIPIADPAGGHCVVVDAGRFTPFIGADDPASAFCAWLYLNAGVRAGRHSMGMQRGDGLRSLVRIAIPLGWSVDTADAFLHALGAVFAAPANIPVLRVVDSKQGFGDASARYALDGFRKVELSAWNEDHSSMGPPPIADRVGVQSTSDASYPAEKGPAMSDIAIVGMAGRYPGAKNVSELWANLRAGVDSVTPLPEDRYQRRLRYGEAKRYRGGFIEDVDRFDSLFFNIPPKDAERLDPQERLFVEVAWEALEDAGYYPEAIGRSVQGNRVGVFVGAVWAMYQALGIEERHAGQVTAPNSFLWSIANRVSYAMNFSGPSLTVDTACSSSLTALYLACEAIRHGECTSAIVGGVNLDLHQSKWDINWSGGALSPDGVCRSFGQGANGYVAGEGIGALFIKPLSQALADGDQVHGVIRGMAVNHGGRTSGFVVPNPKAQTQLVRSALERAGIAPDTIGYIEAHGTGTELGDPLEMSALNAAFRDAGMAEASCAVGSLKSNIGHLEAAAGVAGVTKVLLQMRHRELVPSLHSSVPNEHIDFRCSPFRIQQVTQSWEPVAPGVPLRAGISSFGAGGANAHVVLERFEVPLPSPAEAMAPSSLVFPLSARTEAQRDDAVRRLRDFLSGDHGATALADIAFTLQQGRKPFEHRVAVAAASTSELIERLESYLAGRKHSGIAIGNGRTADPVLRLMSRGERQEVAAMLASRADPNKLARLWADGLLTDWADLAVAPAGRRVSLPTYPFADKRHWVPDDAPARSMGSGSVALHPMIDDNASTFERQVFRKSFHDRDFFIYDHKVMDVPTLPGVAYLELARKAGELAAGMPVRRLRNILWVSPIAVRDVAHEARVELFPGPDGVAFEVYSEGEGGRKILHSQGRIGYAPSPGEHVSHVDLEAIRKRCRKVAEGDDVYPRFRDLGLDLGPSFRSLREVYRGDGEALGLLRLPEARRADLSELILHPSLIDGALQAGVAAELAAGDARMLVPFSIGEVEIFGAPGDTCWTWVTEVVDERSGKSAVSRKDVTLIDPDGQVLVRIREATGVPIGDVHKSATVADGVTTHVYVPGWEDAAPPDGGAEGTLLLVGVDPACVDAFVAIHAGRVVPVYAGDDFVRMDDGGFRARLDRADHLDKVLDAVGVPAVAITLGSGSADSAVLDVVFGLYQALARKRLDRPVRILHGIVGEATACPRQQALVGMLRSLKLENARIDGSVVEWHADGTDLAGLARTLLAESAASDAAWIRHAQGVRQIARLSRLEGHSVSSVPVRSGGTWFITGGAGGLGLIFGRWLAETHGARVVLMGRSACPAELESHFTAWRERGSDGAYVRGDVSREDDVFRCVAEARTRFGELHGVIHAAGILRDGYLRQSLRDDFDAVLAPKVAGTMFLDEATRNDPLDCFVLCSSMTALGGNAGQTAYAYANHFMDDFAVMREAAHVADGRKGRTLSVNWSLWADGGMRLDEVTERMFLDTLGITPLPAPQAMQAFADLLASGLVQAAVVEGVREKIERAWGIRKPDKARPLPVATESANGGTGANELAATVRSTLRRIAMDMLKLDAEDIATDSVLLDLGFDSIGLTGYANAINEAYGVEVTPVLFFDYPSIGDVADYLCQDCAARVVAVHATDGAPVMSVSAVPVTSGVSAEPIFGRKTAVQGASEGVAQGSSGNRFRDMPIAIVGIAGVMPGSDDLDAFWNHLDNGDDLISVIPRDRWNWEDYFGDPFKEANRSNSKWGGFMNEVDKFDPLFFGISRREAQMMDPQQRIFLETVWKAIENSGHKVSDLSGTRTGLFVGVATNDYVDVMNRHDIDLDGYSASGNSHSVLANRISFLLNLRGPSAPIDTACSSSLVALHRAIESIHTGSCDMALVGGVQVMLSPGAYISFGMAGMLSNDGRCKTFDKRADGYVRGEGSGAILIKPLARAEAEGDHIYAVIRATSENHGGRVTTLTAPNSNAQAELLVDAYTKADVSPTQVGYIECHGTGTGLGDPIEIQALKKAFGELYGRHGIDVGEAHCGLSSAKTNIGHLETAAGIAGILRALLAMRARRIPANVHFQEMNPYIDLKGSPFYIAGRTTDWKAPRRDGVEVPRIAGVSSFGFGGANAHIVLEEYRVPASGTATCRERVFPLSARDGQRVADYVLRMLEHVARDPNIDLDRLAFTLQVGRDAMASRVAVVASDRTGLMDAWRNVLAGGDDASVWQGVVKNDMPAAIPASGATPADVAKAWVEGATVDWHAPWVGRPPRRLPLPGYPFARERCWLPGVDGFRREAKKESSSTASSSSSLGSGTVIAESRWAPLDFSGASAHAGRRHALVPAGRIDTWHGALAALHVTSVALQTDAAGTYAEWVASCLAAVHAIKTPGLVQIVVEGGDGRSGRRAGRHGAHGWIRATGAGRPDRHRADGYARILDSDMAGSRGDGRAVHRCPRIGQRRLDGVAGVCHRLGTCRVQAGVSRTWRIRDHRRPGRTRAPLRARYPLAYQACARGAYGTLGT
ncbi:MAG: Polyketide synthase PksN [Luteibacter sp.]|uniref:SDR family NAD(P)-dependent oxidoreductase n=1 Tax=Luteibacter sp. TaxID=1886636 RepID=UPI00137F7D8D|nr:SDR family NAD(P)-dependent oxidoreductase [Luteibacter sp.]KAF1007427.1 MAG: Polyketide synthase PksN [Luteibacter sp.]